MSFSIKILVASFGVCTIFLSACGSSSSDKTTDTATSSTVSFSDVKSTISAKCGGSTCHSSGTGRVALVDNEANVKANATSAAAYIRRTSNPRPPSGSSSLTTSEKSQLLTYLDAQK